MIERSEGSQFVGHRRQRVRRPAQRLRLDLLRLAVPTSSMTRCKRSSIPATRSARSPRSPASAPQLVLRNDRHDRVAFCNTGSEAVMAAMRIARTVTGRDKIAMFTGAYHGIFDEVLVRVHAKRDELPLARRSRPASCREACENMLVLDYGTPESL